MSLRSSLRSVSSAALMCFLACGDDSMMSVDAAVDVGAADAGADVTLDVGTDAFVRETPPTCDPLPSVAPPACGSGAARTSLLPGPGAEGHDAALAAKARRYDRVFHALAAVYTGVNTEVIVARPEDRELVTRFVTEDDGWDFAAYAGAPPEDAVGWAKVAGLYAGVGAAADAFRYATLRDEGAACEEVERARAHVVAALEGVHRAMEITGTEGVIARGYQRRDLAFYGHETVPLFDGEGNPLPEEKNNGTWRDDVSGEHPDWRSDPYRVNGGSEAGTVLFSGVDFRVAYWMARYLKVD